MWENNDVNSFIQLLNTGNIVLPANQKKIVLRHNDVVAFVWNNLAGKWALESISRQRLEGTSFPVTGYWFEGEFVWNNYNTSVIGWRCKQSGFAHNGNWQSGAVNAFGRQIVSVNGKVYRALANGVSGNTAPDHLSGTASDGNMNWLFLGDPYVVDSVDISYSKDESDSQFMRVFKAAASGNGSATIWNIPHGLGVKPTYVGLANPRNLVTSEAGIKWVDADVTNFIIYTNSALATGSNNGVWDIPYKF